MKRILKKMSKAVQVVLAAPVKLPGKIVQVAKYATIALGILEAIVPDKKKQPTTGEEDSGEAAD